MAVGKKTGGRKKGSRNKSIVARQMDIEKSGETPLKYMLRVMRDPAQQHERRDEMAKAAAAYVHAKLSSVHAEHSGTVTLEQLITQGIGPKKE